ncbi:DUF2914 domain-containing protein [Hahella sp. KA22]|uniref:DUF2914 domain-containing protein n=1 Tax=Hahella sp. KA22 TaxID=1628392 RepID=UPI000FDF60CB|nr:DUF2914 domain-containing protein [Hahella sp. KA22]AZZ91863.1 DUF2914 domain-containing protein [Hahella sp. KA22]QAY55234.1 DUF2914 domain-containing protein [Hahella sp. KA22]
MSQKLVIRVKNAESLADASAKPPQTVTVYHWNRIIAAGCAAFALFAGAFWGVYRWSFATPPDASQTDLVAQNEPPVIANERPEQAVASTSVSLAAEDRREASVDSRAELPIDGPIIADAAPEVAAEPVVAPDPVAPESRLEERIVMAEPAAAGALPTTPEPEAPQQVQEAPQVQEESNSADATLAQEAQPEVETLEDVEQVDVAQDSEEESVDPTKRRHLETVSSGGEPVKIFSDAISRAQLTQELDDSEPTNALRNSIVMNDEGLLRIYLFTEMMDMTGQTLYHDWYRGDKRVARIRIRPHRSPMRASSSKFIDRHMLGQWTVKVTGPEGDILAEAAFSVN